MNVNKLIVQKGARYEIRADEIAPGLYRLFTCVAGPSRHNRSPGNGGESLGMKGRHQENPRGPGRDCAT